jgi:hypothetical protein
MRHVFSFAMAAVCSLLISCGSSPVDAVNAALEELGNGATTFQRLQTTLEDVKQGMDKETYKAQVQNLITTTGQVAQISTQGLVDFTRARLREDLEDLKVTLLGGTPSPRPPVLSGAPVGGLDYENRHPVVVVGWNLGRISSNRKDFPITIENLNPRDSRDVPAHALSFQGSYSITLDLKATEQLRLDDVKIVFGGLVDRFEVPIINSRRRYISKILFDVGTHRDDKDPEITFSYTAMKKEGSHEYGSIAVGGGVHWADGQNKIHWRTFEFPINGGQIEWHDRRNFHIRVRYGSMKGDPRWIGVFRAWALVGDEKIEIVSQTSDFAFGHLKDGNPVDQYVPFDR